MWKNVEFNFKNFKVKGQKVRNTYCCRHRHSLKTLHGYSHIALCIGFYINVLIVYDLSVLKKQKVESK